MCKRSSLFRKDMVIHLESQHAWTMDKKPRIYDCYEVLEKVAWIWRVLALFPFTIKYPMGIKKYKINRILAVYCFLICFSCIGNTICGLIHFRRILRRKLTMALATTLIRAFSSLLCLIISTVGRIFRHKELTESINSMAAQEAFLEKIGCRLNHERKAKILFASILATLLVIVWWMAYDLYAAGPMWGRMHWVLSIIPVVAQLMNLTIFVSLVGLLGFKFRALNEKIRTIVTRADASSPKLILTSDVCAENLRLAARAHHNICGVGKRINNFFSWDVIIHVITAFVVLSSTLYYIFVEVQREGKTNTWRIGIYVHWELIHSVPIIIIVIICNWTTRQSIHAGKFIHEIRVEKPDSQLYEAVKSFSLQLHHQKLEFTGRGLFPLNSTLLQTMVGNITTYLVILIQFHPSSDF